MTKQIAVDAHTVHVEKVPEHEDLVSRMNTLDPPVTPEEEKRVKRKIDLRLPPFLLILYMFTWLDRGALGTCWTSLPTHTYLQYHRQCCIDGHQDRLETHRSTVQSRRQHVLRGHMRGRLVYQHRHALHSTQPVPGGRHGECGDEEAASWVSNTDAAHQIIWGAVASLQAVAGGASGLYAIRFFLGIFEAAFISGAPYLTTILYPRAVSKTLRRHKARLTLTLPGLG